jgi:phosphoglycolate phosphatase-like HAD superfamily hydrolase
MTFFALDFDGVLCDSAAETAASAWKCAWELWPELLTTQQIPEEMTDRFLRVRPYLETGWQSVLMLRMLLEKQPLSAFQNELEQNCQRLLQDSGLDTASMIRKFAQSRDHWIQEDQQGWLNSHRFYPGSIAALRKAMQQHEVRILTTKQERFAQLLLQGQGIDFPENKIWGLEAKRPKEDLLEEFIRDGAGDICFVEDRLETLLRVVARPQLARVRLYYALWGYGTEAEKKRAQATPAITCLELAQFNQMLQA